jgi:regulator of protease activity HflC (stomatin/prohibitin superfamily)
MATPAEIAAGITVEVFFAALALGLLYRVWGKVFPLPKRAVILAFQRGVILRNGTVEKVLGPGTYWLMPSRTPVLCDMRAKPFQVAGQEAITSDGMGVRLSLGGEYRIADPAVFLTESTDAFSALFLEVRQALHRAVGESHKDFVLTDRQGLVPRIKELIAPRSAQLGVEVSLLDVWEAVPLGWVTQSDFGPDNRIQ